MVQYLFCEQIRRVILIPSLFFLVIFSALSQTRDTFSYQAIIKNG
jgi:hypothetical protein